MEDDAWPLQYGSKRRMDSLHDRRRIPGLGHRLYVCIAQYCSSWQIIKVGARNLFQVVAGDEIFALVVPACHRLKTYYAKITSASFPDLYSSIEA